MTHGAPEDALAVHVGLPLSRVPHFKHTWIGLLDAKVLDTCLHYVPARVLARLTGTPDAVLNDAFRAYDADASGTRARLRHGGPHGIRISMDALRRALTDDFAVQLDDAAHAHRANKGSR